LDSQLDDLNKMEYHVASVDWKLKRATKECEKITKPAPLFSWLFYPFGRIF